MSAARFRWQPARTWLALILYWLTSMIGATLVESDRAGSQAWIILVMLIMVGVCAFNPRQPWPWWRKLLTVLGAWIAQALLQVGSALLALLLISAVGAITREKLDRLIGFAAALPVVIYAMRQSRLFVTAKIQEGLPASSVESHASSAKPPSSTSAFPETFFVQKIEQAIGPNLTDREREMLLTPVTDLAGTFDPEEGLVLQVKCHKALSNAYRTDVGNTPLSPASAAVRRSNAEQWREANVRLYQSSNRVISGIVQNWYLSEGRNLEVLTRMRPVITAAVVIGLLLLVVVVLLARG